MEAMAPTQRTADSTMLGRPAHQQRSVCFCLFQYNVAAIVEQRLRYMILRSSLGYALVTGITTASDS